MTRVAIVFALLSGLVALLGGVRARGEENSQYRDILKLDSGQLLVVEESALEPRSVGSYVARVYSGRNPEFPFDDFVAGVILPRHGVLAKVCALPAEQAEQSVAVIVRSVGTGGYLSGHLLLVGTDGVTATPFSDEQAAAFDHDASPCGRP
jgi:hypothetical protein